MPFNPDVLELFRLAYPFRAVTEIGSVELPHPDERSAEELEEARWQTALMPMSHHRDLLSPESQPRHQRSKTPHTKTGVFTSRKTDFATELPCLLNSP